MTYLSPIGPLELSFDGPVLTALRLDGGSPVRDCRPLPAEVLRWLGLYFSGCNPGFLPPLAPQGTAFAQRVWQELLRIPYGTTVTYGELARRVGCRSAQAVGQAVGRNPIAIIIPCHRVVAAHSLGGYAYGTDVKRRLIESEHPGRQTR